MHHSRGDLYRHGTSFVIFMGGGVSTTIGGIIDAGDEFHIYHGILLGQIKTFGIRKKKFTDFAQTPPQRAGQPFGLNHMYRLSMLIGSFYSKTYIIIPACTYDDSLPSSLARLLVADGQELVSEVSDTWTACG